MTIATCEPAALTDLARTINAEHGQAQSAARQALKHAINAGEALLAAREEVPAGEWQTWVATNCDLEYFTAVTYCRLASYKYALLSTPERLTVSEAVAHIRGLPAADGRRPRYDEGLRDEASRLHRAGLSVAEISRRLGPNRTTITTWTNPSSRGARDAAARRRRRRQERAQLALRREETAKRAKRVGGAFDTGATAFLRAYQYLSAVSESGIPAEARACLGALLGKMTEAESDLYEASVILSLSDKASG